MIHVIITKCGNIVYGPCNNATKVKAGDLSGTEPNGINIHKIADYARSALHSGSRDLAGTFNADGITS